MLSNLRHRYRVWRSERRERAKEKDRSPHWSATRNYYLGQHHTCEACGGDEHLQVHHVEPFHLHPELELDFTNFIALCMGPDECHLRLGHGDDFKAWNPDVRRHAAPFKRLNSEQRALVWQNAKLGRQYGTPKEAATGS